MISLPTAKILLFIALSLGPKDTVHEVWISSKTDNCVWTQKAYGWNLEEKGTPTHSWPAGGVKVPTTEISKLAEESPTNATAIAHHDWSAEPILFLDNGDRVEKRGTKIFYTSNSGSANEKILLIRPIETKAKK